MNDMDHNIDNPVEDDLSLEAILAEYKSEAFIAGEKKTPKDILDGQADQILQDALASIRRMSGLDTPESAAEPVAEPVDSVPDVSPVETPPIEPVLTQEEASAEQLEPTILLPNLDLIEQASPPPPVVQLPSQPETSDSEEVREQIEPGKVIQIPFPSSDTMAMPDIQLSETGFTDASLPDTDPQVYADLNKIADYASSLDEEVTSWDDDEEEDRPGLFSRFRRDKGRKDTAYEPDSPEEEGEYDEEELLEDGISLRQAAGEYGKGIAKYQMRGMLTILLALLMLLFTALGDGGRNLPGVMGSFRGLTATLLVMQLLAMFLSSEVVATGLLDIFRLRPGAETLVTIAALASIADAAWILYDGATDRGLTYAAVVAFALGTSMLGIKSVRNAMKLTLRTAATGRSPYVVSSKFGAVDNGFALFKSRTETEGFVRKIQQMDFSEYVYSMAAPLLIVMSAVFAVFAAWGGTGDLWDAIQHFAAMTAVSATFTGLLAYGVPYSLLARKLAKVGAALAGWGGAAEVSGAEGVIVTDSDVFPAGTLSFGGVKIFSKTEPDDILIYTASILIASGCGLSEVFQEILNKQKLPYYPVTDLACYEGGGIGGTVDDQEIIVGSASLMNLMGVRLPQSLNVKNAVFSAMGGELVGVFAIQYSPRSSVKEALLSLLHSKVQPLFAVRDFNVSPIMLQTKFQISMEQINFLTYEERYALSDLEPDPQSKPFAVLCREGLGPLADIIVGGKRLRWAVVRNTILSVASAVIGLILLLSFFWAGAAETVSAANVFYYLGAWLFVICLLSRTVTLD